MKRSLRLGTRGSPLALIQTQEVRQRLMAAHPDLEKEFEIEIVPIRTSGDWKPEQRESRFIELGGNKEMFTKEIEDALQSGDVDMAIHSMKDVSGRLPEGLEIAAILERVDPRDAFIGRHVRTIGELPNGASIGTCSLRRQAQILAHRPDLRVVPLRGNVDTRLKKLENGMADATLLAVAGLTRLDAAEKISSIMETDVMLPAAGQGAIGIEIRRGDEATRELLKPINSEATSICVGAERAVLYVLDGSCHTPIGALANLTTPDEITLEALVARVDGTDVLRMSHKGPSKNAEAIGAELGHMLKAKLPPNFFDT